MAATAAQFRREVRAAMEFLSAVREDPSLLHYFEEDILSLEDLSDWAQSLGYELSDESLTRALETELHFRWASGVTRIHQPS